MFGLCKFLKCGEFFNYYARYLKHLKIHHNFYLTTFSKFKNFKHPLKLFEMIKNVCKVAGWTKIN